MAQDKQVILITGCNGRIGFQAASRLAKRYQIVGCDLSLVGKLPDIEFVLMDLASEESVKTAIAYIREQYGNQIASVIHLAAFYTFAKRFSPRYDRITVQGTHRLLQALRDMEVEQFIFSSTMLLHQPCEMGKKITEESPLNKSWGYPLSKIETEQLIHEERGTIPSVILRIAGVYDDHCHSIPLSNQMQRIRENQMEAHLFAGDPSHGAAFVHMDDLIDAICLCIEKKESLPEELTLLIGESETLSYDAIQRQMTQLLHGKEWKTWSLPKSIAKVGAWMQGHLPFFKRSFIKPWMIDIADDHYVLDIRKAKRYLGWTPKHTLKETIPTWAKELQKDPVSWYDENQLR